MNFINTLILIASPFFADKSYTDYHKRIIGVESLIAEEKFAEALGGYQEVFGAYDFVFLRDVQNAAQLAAHLRNDSLTFLFLDIAVRKGWKAKQMRKNDSFREIRRNPRFKKLLRNSKGLRQDFLADKDADLRAEMRRMIAKDQKRALRVAFTPGKGWREKYTQRKFVPQNRRQVRRINVIIDTHGFPAEKSLGIGSWATVIISHNEHDSIYTLIRPKLVTALEKGEISPAEFAIVDTWHIGVDSGWKQKGFGIFEETFTPEQVLDADNLRRGIGLRSIELNNKLLDIQTKFDFDLHLAPFHGGYVRTAP